MKSTGKKLMITAACIFAVGIVFSIIGILLGGWPGFSISQSGILAVNRIEEPYTLEKTKIDPFTKTDLALDYADIDMRISEDDNYYLEYRLAENSGEPVYEVSNDTFRFRQKNTHSVLLFLGTFDNIQNETPYMCLYIPKNAAIKSLVMSSESGDYSITGIKATSFHGSSGYGSFRVKDCTFDELALTAESADLDMQNSAAKYFSFSGSYGDITLNKFSAESVNMELESYDVKIDAVKLGSLDYSNEYGELELILPEKPDTYSFNISVTYGEIKLPDSAPLGRCSNDEEETTYQTEGTEGKTIKIESESGDVVIR